MLPLKLARVRIKSRQGWLVNCDRLFSLFSGIVLIKYSSKSKNIRTRLIHMSSYSNMWLHYYSETLCRLQYLIHIPDIYTERRESLSQICLHIKPHICEVAANSLIINSVYCILIRAVYLWLVLHVDSWNLIDNKDNFVLFNRCTCSLVCKVCSTSPVFVILFLF